MLLMRHGVLWDEQMQGRAWLKYRPGGGGGTSVHAAWEPPANLEE